MSIGFDTIVEVWESAKSRKSNIGREESSRTLELFVRGAADEFQAELAVGAWMPGVYGGLPFDSVDLEELFYFSGLFRATVSYKTPKKQDPGFATIEFDTTGGQTKIKTSLATINSYGQNGAVPGALPGAGNPPPKFNGAINASGTTSAPKVEGVELVTPKLKFTISGVLSFEDCSLDYVKALAALTGTMNDSPFLGFDEHELLFLGASGQTRKASEDQPGVDIKWQFEASQNATDLTIGGIEGIEKDGHDYLWTHHVPEADMVANMLAVAVDGVYVERVYQEDDFTKLKIPDVSDQENPQGYPV